MSWPEKFTLMKRAALATGDAPERLVGEWQRDVAQESEQFGDGFKGSEASST